MLHYYYEKERPRKSWRKPELNWYVIFDSWGTALACVYAYSELHALFTWCWINNDVLSFASPFRELYQALQLKYKQEDGRN